MNRYVQRFSREYSPGAMKAQSWYSQIGLVMIAPAMMETLMCR